MYHTHSHSHNTEHTDCIGRNNFIRARDCCWPLHCTALNRMSNVDFSTRVRIKMGSTVTFLIFFVLTSSFIFLQVEAFRPIQQELTKIGIQTYKNAPSPFQSNLDGTVHARNIINDSETFPTSALTTIVSLRGGAEEDESKSVSFPIKVVSMIGNSIFESVFAVSRALEAGIEVVRHDSSNPVTKMFHIMSSMFKATFDKHYEPQSREMASKKDFGAYLCKAYGVHVQVQDEVEDEEVKSVKVYAGSFAEALIKARSKARLLLVFIPSSKPKKQPNDVKAIQSIFSSEVSQVAERPARKKQQEGSFSFWSTKYDSNEATTAMKRLKTASKVTSGKGKGKQPVLMVIYPSATMTSSGVKIVPRVLAQHHCNPPPDAESMAMWLNALRKRHAKQYANMQHELKEMELFKERQKGFQSSLKDDRKREEEERLKEQKAVEEEKARKERDEEVKLRRIELLEALPEEPETGSDGVVTIALRFSDGRKGQRRFVSDSLIDDVFNWIDAIFKTERETVELMTMTGTKKFSFGDDGSLTLEDAGLGKMAALRVIEKQVEDGDGDNEASEDDTDEDSEEE